jgi:thiol-disulfide isomerase/thioredoxin
MIRVIIALLAAVLVLSMPAHAKPSTAPKIAIGDIPPDYLGQDRHGQDILASAQRGKVVVVTFWATWCPPCLRELPVLQGIREQVGTDKLSIVAINLGQGKKVYRKILERMPHYTLTFAYDERDRAAKAFGVKSLPHMFIFDKHGRVASIHMGYGDDTLAALVDELNTLLLAK